MAQRDDMIRLQHMLDHAQEAVEMATGKQRKDLDSNRQFSLAITRLVEIIGEAAAGVSTQGQQQFPSIPWREIISMRNRLIHGYDAVDHDILWDIIQYDLPDLIISLKNPL